VSQTYHAYVNQTCHSCVTSRLDVDTRLAGALEFARLPTFLAVEAFAESRGGSPICSVGGGHRDGRPLPAMWAGAPKTTADTLWPKTGQTRRCSSWCYKAWPPTGMLPSYLGPARQAAAAHVWGPRARTMAGWPHSLGSGARVSHVTPLVGRSTTPGTGCSLVVLLRSVPY
jgi:hypothetical protein